MRRFRLTAETAPVVAVGALTAVAVSTQSFALALIMLLALEAAFRLEWWMPGAFALVLLAAAPAYAAIGKSGAVDVLATLILLLAAMSLVHLVILERKRITFVER